MISVRALLILVEKIFGKNNCTGLIVLSLYPIIYFLILFSYVSGLEINILLMSISSILNCFCCCKSLFC